MLYEIPQRVPSHLITKPPVMKRTAAARIVFLLLLFSCAQVKKTTQRSTESNAMPLLRVANDSTAKDITVSSMVVDVSVAANIATTTFDMEFYNPNDRILEGEFEFPLTDGQHIIRYALDMEGKLREGVVVEKAKGRVAFENTIRMKIDPGLVEKTKGNNFRTRIYPLPANGTRHIVIAIEQILDYPAGNDLVYQLPLKTKQRIGKFSVKSTVYKTDLKPVMAEGQLPGFNFVKSKGGWQASFSQNDFVADNTIAFSMPHLIQNGATVLAENYNKETFFYVNSRMEPLLKKKTVPKTIGLFWDISGSSEKRDIEKEKLLLKEYLSTAGDVTVSLIPFHITTLPEEDFVISGGNSSSLLKRLAAFQYDGGTQFGSIDLTQYKFDEALLFSDGLGTFGKKEIIFSNVPVISVNSSPSADFSFLKYAAKTSNGKFIDLTKLDVATAVEEVMSLSLQVVHAEYDPAAIEDLALQVSPVQLSGLSFAGKLKTSSATIRIDLGYGNEVTESKTFTITRPAANDYEAVKRVWAEMKIAGLDLRYEKNKEAITQLGKEFTIVTQNTSLIVLDRVEDYVENEITPPEELQEEYFAQLKTKQDADKDKDSVALDEALAAMDELKEWYNSSFDQVKKPVVDSTATRGRVDMEANMLIAVPDTMAVYNLQGNAMVSSGFATTNTAGAIQHFSATLDSDGDGVAAGFDTFKWENGDFYKSSIEVKEWKADEPYLKELEKLSEAKRMAKYFELKKKYESQPSFFIDVARFFFEKNEKEFGLQVLSNVAEMKLENAELIRNLANQLMDAAYKELALETFKDAMKMREEDPQSYRDLGLAYNETGDHVKAVELLYKVITGSWDERFGDVKAICINEMNAIISAHAVPAMNIDSRLIYPMPVDVRIVISWSSDNTDIDLWVTDPAKEKCDYSHNRTEIGGKMSQDVTQGFGPEEFSLKKAVDGKYTIEVNLYGDRRQSISGPIAIRADMFTNYGKSTQKKEVINFRVKENKEVIELGSLKFGS